MRLHGLRLLYPRLAVATAVSAVIAAAAARSAHATDPGELQADLRRGNVRFLGVDLPPYVC